jgi:hypothetical protein
MIIKGGFLTMGTKRVGLARVEALIENLQRDLDLSTNSITLTQGIVILMLYLGTYIIKENYWRWIKKKMMLWNC